MVDNFKQISELLTFDSEDEFYFLQILQRKKDNPGGVNGSNNSSRLIKAYYINSVKHLMDMKDEIIFFCKHFNARAGINLNKRSYEKTAFNTLKKVAEVMHNKNYKMVKRAWNTSCGVHNGGDKIWLLDVDEPTIDPIMVSFIDQKCQPVKLVDNKIESKIIARIPSRNGWHLITKGFDMREFKIKFPDTEVHKNNPVALYYP